MFNLANVIKNKELLIALYFLLFILGFTIGITPKFYNEFRILEVLLLLIFSMYGFISKSFYISKIEILFFLYMCIASLFWQHYEFIVIDLLLAYLLYKTFSLLKYNELVSKIIVFFSLLIFPLLPLSVFDYISTDTYYPVWYPMPWNIRIYDSYLLIVSIFAVWFYLTETKYKKIYLLFILLAFFSILLNGGRSAALSYSIFIIFIVVFNRSIRLQILLVYGIAWLSYLSITYLANLNSASSLGIHIVRTTSSLRYDLWVNALQCWSQHPIVGCGFYQLDNYPSLAAHPHNLIIQILTETGLLGLGFLVFVIFFIVKNISWNFKKNYFVLAALIAISIDMSLSGSHIYPITQIALIWLMVFLLKNPIFQHAYYFNMPSKATSFSVIILSHVIYLSIIAIFFYLFTNTNVLLDGNMPFTPPRFWEYGYQLI